MKFTKNYELFDLFKTVCNDLETLGDENCLAKLRVVKDRILDHEKTEYEGLFSLIQSFRMFLYLDDEKVVSKEFKKVCK